MYNNMRIEFECLWSSNGRLRHLNLTRPQHKMSPAKIVIGISEDFKTTLEFINYQQIHYIKHKQIIVQYVSSNFNR